MSQSDLKASFANKNHRQIYSAVASENSAITVKSKVIVITERSKGIDYVIANVFGIANAFVIMLLTKTKNILKKAHTLLKNIFVNIVFCYCSMNIINRKIVIDVFKFIRDKMKKSNILILDATYFHSLKIGLDIFDEDLNRNFDVNFITNVNFVRIFFDPKTQYSEIKILINVSIVAAHTQQFNMSIYDVNKAAFVH